MLTPFRDRLEWRDVNLQRPAKASPSRWVVALIVVIGVYATLTSAGIVHPATHPSSPDRYPMPLGYGPSWLPDGLVEVGRSYGSGERIWAPAGTVGVAKLRIYPWPFYAGRRDLKRSFFPETPRVCRGFERAEAVDVNGRPGRYGVTGPDPATADKPAVCWPADRDTLITVVDDGLGLSRADLIRIAASMRPDARWTTFPIAVPPDAEERIVGNTMSRSVTVSGSSPTIWKAEVAFRTHSKGGRDVTITARTAGGVLDNGERLVVAGRQARYVKAPGPRPGTGYLAVDLGGSVRLTIEVGYSSMGIEVPGARVLAGVVEHTQVDWSSLQWLGARGLVGPD